MCRVTGQSRQQRDRLEIGHVLRPAAQRIETAVPHCRRIREEDEIEFGALGGLGELNVVLKVGAGVDLGVRVQPGRDVVAGRMKERAECELSLASISHAGLRVPVHVVNAAARSC
jgi:hypothetical protein